MRTNPCAQLIEYHTAAWVRWSYPGHSKPSIVALWFEPDYYPWHEELGVRVTNGEDVPVFLRNWEPAL